MRVGGKPLELQPGKAAISIGSLDKLPATLDALITAVRAGRAGPAHQGGSSCARFDDVRAAEEGRVTTKALTISRFGGRQRQLEHFGPY